MYVIPDRALRSRAAVIFVMLLLILFPGVVMGDGAIPEENSIVVDEDSMFGGSGEETEPIIEVEPAGESSDLFFSGSIDFGGSYAFSGSADWSWSDPAVMFSGGSIAPPDRDSARVDLGARFFYDARPIEDFRVFGKASISHPFGTDDTRGFEDIVRIEELFSDVTFGDAVYVRGGKHTINWGVGYFFSPADLLNLAEINPRDPDAEREGPISVKIHYPFSIHNFYLYLIANGVDEWDDFGIAPKAEFLLGSVEIGLGGLYQKNLAPALMLTATGPVFDIDLFAEAVVKYGSDRRFVRESETAPGIETFKPGDGFFFHLALGGSYIRSFENGGPTINLAAQYWFNGEGYEDSSVISDHPLEVAILVSGGDLSMTELTRTGMHYGAASLGLSDIFGSPLAFRLFWIHNFGDMSGIVSPGLSADLFDDLSTSFTATYRYGDTGDEYTPAGEALSLGIEINLGSGGF